MMPSADDKPYTRSKKEVQALFRSMMSDAEWKKYKRNRRISAIKSFFQGLFEIGKFVAIAWFALSFLAAFFSSDFGGGPNYDGTYD